MANYMIAALQNEILTNKAYSSAEKTKKILEAFSQASDLILDKDTGRYYEKQAQMRTIRTKSAYSVREVRIPAVDAGGINEWTLLCAAARTGDIGVVQWLIENQGADVNLPADFGRTPLWFAAEAGHAKVMEYLISKGADVNLATTAPHLESSTGEIVAGTTPLHRAVRFGQTEAVRLLISKKAKLTETRNTDKNTRDKKVDDEEANTVIKYAKELLRIISALEKGIELPETKWELGSITSKGKDERRIPETKDIAEIIQLLEAYSKILKKEAADAKKVCDILASIKKGMPYTEFSKKTKELSEILSRGVDVHSADPTGRVPFEMFAELFPKLDGTQRGILTQRVPALKVEKPSADTELKVEKEKPPQRPKR